MVSALNAKWVTMGSASIENLSQNSFIVLLSSVPLIIASGIEITTLRSVNKQLRMMKESLTYQTGVRSTTMTSFTETTSESHLKRERKDSMLQCVLTITECMKKQNVETPKALKVKKKEARTVPTLKKKTKETCPAPALKKGKKTERAWLALVPMKKLPLMTNHPFLLVNKTNLKKMRKTLTCLMKKI